MKIDTSSYYPKSPLDDEPDDNAGRVQDSRSLFPEKEKTAGKEPVDKAPEAAKTIDLKKDSDPLYETEPAPATSDWEKFLNGAASFISWVLVPLLIPVYGILLAFDLSILHFKPEATKWIFTLLVALFNMVIPMILVLLLKKFGFINDIGLNGRRERLIPYIITIVCMGGTALFMHAKMAPMWLVMFFAGGVVAGIINLLINFKWKISAHAAGIAGIVALIVRIMHSDMPVGNITVWLMVAIGLGGLLGSARVWLGRHTVWQVLAGYAVGFCSVFFMTMIH